MRLDIIESSPQQLGARDKETIALFLAHRLVGVKRAIVALRRAAVLDTEGWAAPNLAYYKHVKGFLIQMIKQLGFDPAAVEGDDA